jgi:chemotaxis response regulator CheB
VDPGQNKLMGNRRVLVIEDDAAVRLALEVFLSAEEGVAEVVTAEDGDRGIDGARRMRPDVIVTDSSMPGTAGAELGRSLRESCPSATIISFSGLIQDAPWADHRIQKGGSETFDELARAVAGAPVQETDGPSEKVHRENVHDIRNALTPIAGYASLLESGIDQMSREQVREVAQRMIEAVERANNMLDSF